MSLNALPSLQPGQPYTYLTPPGFKLEPDLLVDTATPPSWLLDSSENRPRKSSKHHSRKKDKKKRKSKKKQRRKQQIGAYVVQLIGLICLVLAAFKGCEPLTGVGFTLVIVGYKGGLGEGGVGNVLKSERKGKKKSKKDKSGSASEKEKKLLTAEIEEK